VIVTVTPNPAVDLTYQVGRLVRGASHRVTRVLERAGGKGLNVARVLHALGEAATVVAPLGGPAGEWVARALAAEGLVVRPVPVAGETRRTVTVLDGEATVLNEPGPRLPPSDWQALLDAVETSVGGGASALVISGSVPPGAPADLYPRLVEMAGRVGVPAIVDTGGPALLAAAEAGPAVVKPNAEELAAATGEPDLLDGARGLLARGAQRVVVSLGSAGMLAVSAGDAWRVRGVPGVHGNPTGAGDATVAALALAVTEGCRWPEPLLRATALGAAAVLAGAAGEVDLAAYRAFLPALSAEEIR
jgi:tagatose 6-phosphate kinase